MQHDFITGGLSRFIIWLYNFLGLISIPLLTFVTVFSMSNVFLRGQLAEGGWQVAWAFIFATAIEVNVVRLLFEWKGKGDWNTLALAISLGAVACIALLTESLQTSIGVDWNNWAIRAGIIVVLTLRVIMVMWLLAREGYRYGTIYRTQQQQALLQQVPTKPQKQPAPKTTRIASPLSVTSNGHSDATVPTTVLDPQDSNPPF